MNIITPFLKTPLEDKIVSGALIACAFYFDNSYIKGFFGLAGAAYLAGNYFAQMNTASASMAMDIQYLERAILEANENSTLPQKKAAFISNYDALLKTFTNLPPAQIPPRDLAALNRCRAHLTTSTPLEVRVNTLQGFNKDLEDLRRETMQAVERRDLPAQKASLVQRFNNLLQMGYILQRIQPQEAQNLGVAATNVHRLLAADLPANPAQPAPPARPPQPVLPPIPEYFIAELFLTDPTSVKPATEAEIPPAPKDANGKKLNPEKIFTDLIADLTARGFLNGNTIDDNGTVLTVHGTEIIDGRRIIIMERSFVKNLADLIKAHQTTIKTTRQRRMAILGEDSDSLGSKYAKMTLRIIRHFAHHFKSLKAAADACSDEEQKRNLDRTYVAKLNLFLKSMLPAFKHCINRKSTVFEDLYSEMIECSSDHYEKQTFPKKLAVAMQEFRKHLVTEAINRLDSQNPHMSTMHKWYRKQPSICNNCGIPVPPLSSLDDEYEYYVPKGRERTILADFEANNTPEKQVAYLLDLLTFPKGKPQFFTNIELANWMKEHFDMDTVLDENTGAWRPQALLAMLHKLNFIVPNFQ